MAKKRSASKKKKAAKAKGTNRSFEDLLAGHSAPTQAICRALRGLVQATLPQPVEGIYGGAKVGLALYSIGDGKKVVCGIQPTGDECLFYLHYLKPENSPRLKLEGKGKHALHIRITILNDETSSELVSLLRLAESCSGAFQSAEPGAPSGPARR
jgi:hypothetical protein